MRNSLGNLAQCLMLAAGILCCASGLTLAAGQEVASLTDYAAPGDPPVFDDPAAAVEAFKSVLAKDDFDGLAALLGLDAAKLKTAEGVMDSYAKIRDGAAEKVVVRDLGDRQELDLDRKSVV